MQDVQDAHPEEEILLFEDAIDELVPIIPTQPLHAASTSASYMSSPGPPCGVLNEITQTAPRARADFTPASALLIRATDPCQPGQFSKAQVIPLTAL